MNGRPSSLNSLRQMALNPNIQWDPGIGGLAAMNAAQNGTDDPTFDPNATENRAKRYNFRMSNPMPQAGVMGTA